MKALVIKTVKNQPAMKQYGYLKFFEDDGREGGLINVYPHVKYQEIKGFGGSFTEAATSTFDTLSKENQEKVLRLYFDTKDGLGYNFGRLHINSCDFSLGNYTCVDDGDETLNSFQINRDKRSLIPMIKRALAYNDIQLLASPWSPPAYMKTNCNMRQGGKLKREYYDLWAKYFVKFIESYKNEGVNVSLVTVQNEPKAVQTWDSCVYTAEEERDFIKYHLGEKMRSIGVDILFWDHNKERIVERSNVILSDERTMQYVKGIAFHWYSGDYFEELEMFHQFYPEKDLVFSEGCYEYSLGDLDTTKIGEKYAHDMIGNFNNYCNLFCDWNLLLNTKGGPNYVDNYCDAPIMVGVDKNEIIIRDSYYYIGHFSKYVKKGARRIGSSKFTSALETVSFQNPDNSIVTVVLNRTDNDVKFAIKCEGQLVESIAEAHSISTYVIVE